MGRTSQDLLELQIKEQKVVMDHQVLRLEHQEAVAEHLLSV